SCKIIISASWRTQLTTVAARRQLPSDIFPDLFISSTSTAHMFMRSKRFPVYFTDRGSWSESVQVRVLSGLEMWSLGTMADDSYTTYPFVKRTGIFSSRALGVVITGLPS